MYILNFAQTLDFETISDCGMNKGPGISNSGSNDRKNDFLNVRVHNGN